MAQRLVYMNGEFLNEKDAKISIYDSALMFGDMLFEMTRSFNQIQFKLREHLERLYTGIKILQIPLKISIEEMEKICLQTVEKNIPFFDKNDEHRLLINVSRGPLGIYAPIFDNKIEPTIVVADFPLKWTVAGLAKFYDIGLNLVVTSQRAIPAHLMDPKIKNRSRIWYQMANIEVSKVEGENNWALLLDTDGFVTEGTGDNFFLVKNNKVYTPEGRNILRGISREYIFQLCKQLNIECIEKNLEIYDVYNADEAFVTATPFCIMPVTSLNQNKIGDKIIGKITNELINTWSSNVGLDIVGQIREFSKEVDFIKKDQPTPYSFKNK